MERAMVLPRPWLAVGAPFLTLSVLFSSWIARIPEVQNRLQLSEGQLGLALVGASLGAIVMMPLSGRFLGRLPAGRATLYSTLLFCPAMLLPALAPGLWALMGALFIVGLINSFMNVAMNAAVSGVEKQYGISIMSRCHGMFSLGGVLGAASAGLIAGLGVPLGLHLSVLALLLILFNLSFRPQLLALPAAPAAEETKFVWPRREVWGLAAVGFCVMIGEGAMADWSAVYVRNDLGGSAVLAGFGYAAYSLTMALGRFRGDDLKVRWGARRLLVGGSLIGAAGLLLVVVLPYPAVAVLAFAVVGVGFSIVVPILYGEAARLPDMRPEAGIAVVASSGIAGFLIGPPFIGLLAEHLGLAAGFTFLAGLAMVAALVSRRG